MTDKGGLHSVVTGDLERSKWTRKMFGELGYGIKGRVASGLHQAF